jgi:transposase
MPKVPENTAEFKDRAVRLVVAEQSPGESRSAACERLGPRLGVKPITLYGWVKKAVPRPAPAAAPGSVEELRAQVAALRKENRELARANDILQAAASFFGAALDRQSRKSPGS